jgi:hypothetical protein
MKKKINETQSEKPQVNRHISRRAILMTTGALVGVTGLVMFMTYIFTTNMIIGLPGVVMSFGGGILFYIYWKKDSEIFVDSWDKEPKNTQYNSMSIYPGVVIFEDVENPKGVPWRCLNDGKPYYVNISPTVKKEDLKPLELPDQRYYDPRVFGERVLTLPAHRKLFARKEDLFQKLKPLMVLGAIVIVWILIITTTGN